MPKIAVILFPGTNCELEALRAIGRSGMEPQLIRWNDLDVDYASFDGFFLPGGFSYEDRGRSGIIASKNALLDKIREEAGKGKPVLGVCNGAQIVMESGLIPGLDKNHVEMALAWNKRVDKNGNILGTGFYNDWIYLKNAVPKGRSAFNYYDQDHLIRIPVAHGEGRFTSIDPEMKEMLMKNEQAVFRYCDENGEMKEDFPTNPNGALLNLAGLCNPEGNVMSLMPHPERTEVGDPIFESIREYIGKSFEIVRPAEIVMDKPAFAVDEVGSYDKPDIEVFVDTVITDNEERTLEAAIHNLGFNEAKLKKLLYYGIKTDGSVDKVETADALLKSGEIINMAKESPLVKIEDKYYSFDPAEGLNEVDEKEVGGESYLTFNKEDTVGESRLQTIKHHFSISGVQRIHAGKRWSLTSNADEAAKIVGTHIFHNPHSMDIYKA
ncbi:phosphoribosylformylglycinamidine synthase I [Patescibacteria group bacterium]